MGLFSSKEKVQAGPASKASRSLLAIFGSPHPPICSSLAIVGIPPAPAGGSRGGCPVHKLCSLSPSAWPEKGYECDTSWGPRLDSAQEPLPVGRPQAPALPGQGRCHKPLVLSVWGFFFPIFFMIKTQTPVCHFRMSQLSLRSCADFRLRDFCSGPNFKSNQGLKSCLGC